MFLFLSTYEYIFLILSIKLNLAIVPEDGCNEFSLESSLKLLLTTFCIPTKTHNIFSLFLSFFLLWRVITKISFAIDPKDRTHTSHTKYQVLTPKYQLCERETLAKKFQVRPTYYKLVETIPLLLKDY